MQLKNTLSDRESFDNYLDYKDELEYKYSLIHGLSSRKKIYTAVIDELRDKNLINNDLYEKEKETIEIIFDDGVLNDIIYIILQMLFICIVCGMGIIIVVNQLNILGKQPFNKSLKEL